MSIKEEACEYFSGKQLDFMADFLPKLQLSPEEEYWVAASETRRKELAVAERKRQEEELNSARRRLRTLGGLLALALVALVIAGISYFQAEEAKEEAIEQTEETEKALAQADKLINAFYFYDGKFALAYGEKDYENVFYFIDKEGDEFKKLGRWEKAEQFDHKGFAKIKKAGQDFLLDTFGNTYLVAYNLADLGSNVKAVDLRGTPLRVFPSEILEYAQLEIIILDGEYGLPNQIVLPSKLSQLTQLKILSLDHCSLSALPASIGQLSNLVSLSLYENQINEIPDSFRQLSKLTDLRLGSNQLTEIPNSFAQLSNLTELDLGGNQLTEISNSVGQLTNLTGLYLSDNSLTALPNSIVDLAKLRFLLLQGCDIPQIEQARIRELLPSVRIYF